MDMLKDKKTTEQSKMKKQGLGQVSQHTVYQNLIRQKKKKKKDQDGSSTYKTKKKKTLIGDANLAKSSFLTESFCPGAAERRLNKTGLVVVWNSVPQRTFLRYGKT